MTGRRLATVYFAPVPYYVRLIDVLAQLYSHRKRNHLGKVKHKNNGISYSPYSIAFISASFVLSLYVKRGGNTRKPFLPCLMPSISKTLASLPGFG